jgi:CheY-like chemotaxis protein
MTLEQVGLNALHALNGKQAISMAQEFLPDVIVMDVEMPIMNGFEAAMYLKSDDLTAHIPIIILTAHDNETFVRSGMNTGAIDFIPKDIFSGTVLLDTLEQLGVLTKMERKDAS